MAAKAVTAAKKKDPFDSTEQRTSAGVFGMWLFIVVVAMIFAGCILGYLVVRIDREPGQEWLPAGAPGLPHALLLSTGLLLVSSWSIQTAVRGVRLNRLALAHHAVAWTLVFVGLFLAVQMYAWSELWRENFTIGTGLYAWTFYVLTGVHALHVLGGIPPLVVVFRRSAAHRYTPLNHAGLTYCAMYWHALDVIWIALYATLWFGTS